MSPIAYRGDLTEDGVTPFTVADASGQIDPDLLQTINDTDGMEVTDAPKTADAILVKSKPKLVTPDQIAEYRARYIVRVGVGT